LEPPSNRLCVGSRREVLWQMGAGFAGLALTSLLDGDGFFARNGFAGTPDLNPLAPKPRHFPGKAKSCIFLFMYGGPSQMDMFDYKPELQKRDGQSVKLEIRRRDMQASKLLASKRKFDRYGQSGLWCCDLLPHLSQQMDKLAVIKSLYADSFAHGSAMLQMNSGRIIQGHPSIGSWLSYGLGSINRNLPGYVVMLDSRGGPISGAANWSSGFMPAGYQGTVFRSSGQPILNLTSASGITPEMQRDLITTANQLNAEHMAKRAGYSELQARIASYELAFQLQTTAPEALDLTQESAATREAYGLTQPKPEHPLALGPAPFGRQC